MATPPEAEPGNYPMVPDAALVARARGGDVAAFETLVRRYQRPIYRLAARMLGDNGEAEDVTQDVFVTAWRHLPSIRDGAAIRSWLYRAATNRCLNQARARRPTVPLDHAESPHAGRCPSAEEYAEAAELLAALRAALGRLTADQRACWLLAEVEDLSYRDIAEILNTTPPAVRGRLARARAKLGEMMQSWQ